jgi:hypothetical protein
MIKQIGRSTRQVAGLVLFALMLAVLLAVGCHNLTHPKDLRSVSVTLKRTAKGELLDGAKNNVALCPGIRVVWLPSATTRTSG